MASNFFLSLKTEAGGEYVEEEKLKNRSVTHTTYTFSVSPITLSVVLIVVTFLFMIPVLFFVRLIVNIFVVHVQWKRLNELRCTPSLTLLL